MQNENAPASLASISEVHELTELGLAAAVAAIRNGDITSESYSSALLRRARSRPSACCRRCDEPGGAARLRQTAS
jgi:hypothetical protein